MRKVILRKMIVSGMCVVLVLSCAGCGAAIDRIEVSKNPGIVLAGSDSEIKENLETEVVKPATEDIKNEEQDKDITMVSLPDSIKGMKAEDGKNEALRDLIIDYCEIPEDYHKTTRYFYNYVDLNEDGVNEIFAIVMGPYTSGTGGSTGLWIIENAGKLHVNQDFTLVNAPVIISDTITNGVHELVLPYYGGGAESQYSILTCSDGEYTRVSDGKMVETLEGISGKAIIANDLLAEIDAGIMGTYLSE